MRKIFHERQKHSTLWWLIIGLSLAFGLLLLLVSLGFIPIYDTVFKHFSTGFFLLTLFMTIYMSYRRARHFRGEHYVGPFLCSILFAILTQFILFLLSPFLVWKANLSQIDILILAFVYIVPSLMAFVIVKYLVDHQEISENNQWFDWHYYIRWVEMMSNAMALVIFLELIIVAPSDASLLGVRGTIWAFYSVMAGFISDHMQKKKDAYQVESMEL